ncbi:MAG: sensor domain-containing diguanylate cyclase [Planctomycetota bacterium]
MMLDAKLKEKFEFIVNTSKEFMTMIGKDHRYVMANSSYCEAHKREQKDVIGREIVDIWGEEKYKIIRKYVDECFTGREVHYESWFEFPALGMKCFEVYCYPFFEEQAVTNIVVISRDITERKILQEKVFVDQLTGLYNYRYMNQRIDEEIERAKRYNLNLSLLFADIDFFKKVNDRLGHQTGNDVLIHIAGVLGDSDTRNREGRAKLRKADIVARYGGEEFLVLLPETSKKEAGNIGERIRNTVEGYKFPHYEKNPDMSVTISIGVASYPDDDISNSGDLIKKADLAMYEAKHKGRNRTSMYS